MRKKIWSFTIAFFFVRLFKTFEYDSWINFRIYLQSQKCSVCPFKSNNWNVSFLVMHKYFKKKCHQFRMSFLEEVHSLTTSLFISDSIFTSHYRFLGFYCVCLNGGFFFSFFVVVFSSILLIFLKTCIKCSHFIRWIDSDEHLFYELFSHDGRCIQ